jgi:PKD repeat protein
MRKGLVNIISMTVMSRTLKSALFFSAIGIVAGVGIILIVGYSQIMEAIFQRTADEENGGTNLGGSVPTLGFLTYYKAILSVGEEGTFEAHYKFGKPPYSFEWKFSDGLTLTGQNVTRSFELPGKYSFYLTVTDGNGDKVTSTELSTDVVQQMPKEEGTANVTSTQHN